MPTRIHITVDLEDLIQREINNMKALPLYGASDEKQYQWQCGRVAALVWVLQMAHAELDWKSEE